MNTHPDGHGSGMMWVMMLACALPALAVFFAGSSKGTVSLLLPIAVVLMIGLHVWMMRRHRGHHRHDSHEESIHTPHTNSSSSSHDTTKQP